MQIRHWGGVEARAQARGGRGPTRGIDVQRLVDKTGQLPVPILQEFRAPVGIYASKLASKIGVEVRSHVQDLNVKNWKKVDGGIKGPLLQCLQDQFDMQRDEIDVEKAITTRCGRRLSDYTHRLHKKFKKLKDMKGEVYARSHPPLEINMEQWTNLIEKKWNDKNWQDVLFRLHGVFARDDESRMSLDEF